MSRILVIFHHCVAVVMIHSVNSSSLLLNAIENSIGREKRSTTTNIECQVPQSLEALFTELNKDINVSKFLIYQNATQPASLVENELSENEVYISQNIHSNKVCPPTLDSFTTDDPLWVRSTCPWYYDPEELGSNYYPAHIPQAKCKCNTCIGSTGRTKCERITTQVRVLKKTGCVGGFYTYENELRVVNVGCTCAR
ncbi:hypothetical protein SNE40_002137 [Patella caerulea]|uniref:Interleukin 17-like protein n=1 Tax=Patella caerulea TaxID=87958 RepID=A0AAN8JWZ9_PATCE